MDKRTGTKDMSLFYQRLRNILDAASFREPEKVPVGMDYLGWPYGYSGVTLEQVIGDPEANAAHFCRFMEDIEFDFTMNTGFYEPYDAYAALGSNAYLLSDDKCSVQHNQAAHKFMDEADYEELIRDPVYFQREYYPLKSVPAFQKPRAEAYEMLRQAAGCTARSIRAVEKISRKAIYEHQIVPVGRGGAPKPEPGCAPLPFRERGAFYYAPLDHLFDKYRGMMGVFCDLMMAEDTLDAACAALTAPFPPPAPDEDFTEKPLPFGFTVYHSAPFLTPEQYDKYWFQGFKKAMLPYAEKGLKIYLKGEGSFLHTIERFKEFPRGSIIIQLDMDDPFEAHKRIGGWQTLCTGLRTSMLSLRDKQVCFDYIRKCFDVLAPGGGFLFYQDKPLYAPNDAAPDTVREVWAFANACARGR